VIILLRGSDDTGLLCHSYHHHHHHTLYLKITVPLCFLAQVLEKLANKNKNFRQYCQGATDSKLLKIICLLVNFNLKTFYQVATVAMETTQLVQCKFNNFLPKMISELCDINCSGPVF